jgi:hypothetical protein
MKKNLTLMIAAAVVFAGCSKDESIDPKQQKIEELMAQEKQQAAEVRAAVHPAKYNPINIENFFNSEFAHASYIHFGSIDGAQNLSDSAQMFVYAINGIRTSMGDPIPANNETLTALYNKSETYLKTVEELNQLQK